MALQKFAHGATHYCKFKHKALCENTLHCGNKTTINKPILCRFHNIFFKKSKNWNTPFYLQMFCALSGRPLSWNTPFFNCFTSSEHADFIGCHFFPTHLLPRHTKVQLLRYCGKRSFLDVAKSWKLTLDRVPWFGRHVQFWLWPRLVYSSYLFLVFFLDFDTDSSVRSQPAAFLPTFFNLYW